MSAIASDTLVSKGRLRREGSLALSGIPVTAEHQTVSPRHERHAAHQQSNHSASRLSLKDALSGSCCDIRALVCLVLCLSVLSGFIFLDKKRLKEFALTIEDNKDGYGAAAFFGVTVIAVMCFIPGPILATLSGVLYGKIFGSLIIWSAGTVSQTLTYLLAKYLFRDALVAFVSKRYKGFQAIDNAIAQQGFRIILLLRLAPVIPDSVLNYVLAITSIPYVPYAVSSSIAILPWSIAFAYLGSFATDVSSAANGNVNMNSKLLTAVSIASLLLLLILGCLIARTAKHALENVIDDKSKSLA